MTTERVGSRCANTDSPEPNQRPVSQQAGSSRILHENDPNANVYTRRSHSRIVPACILGFLAFSICFLAGHILAAIFGAYWLVYVGVGVGLWLVASAFICAFVAGATGHD